MYYRKLIFYKNRMKRKEVDEMIKQLVSFDKMITPTIIQVLFWIGVGLSALFGIITIFTGLAQMFSGYGEGFIGFITMIVGLITIGVGVLASRIYCELLIVVFKMHQSLVSINEKLDQNNQ